MRLIEDHILRRVHGNVVLVPLSDNETDFKGMIVLNHSGEFVCRMLQQDTNRERLIEGLALEYEMKPEQVAADLDAFLSELDACHILIR
ncbi:MAG: PqqD family protein [Lachnospiraceae bacterium]|uniref:PqqD family protein n=1 Tax=Lachnospiraceae TaxID=186803 RepID=UPI002A7F3532|nr:PqqD family protein [Blautia sp.]MCI6866856.1 PqqD family protein [Lachnospiraceae bacterium]MDY4114600.1 PqqD family protein [Blautia sp.]